MDRTLKQLEPLLESFQEGVLVCDTTAAIVLANGVARRIFGAAALRLPLAPDAPWQLGEGMSFVADIARNVLGGNDVAPIERALVSESRTQQIRIGALPFRNAEGAIAGALITVVDLTGVRGPTPNETYRDPDDGETLNTRSLNEVQKRLEALATLARHLADARTTAQVAEVVVEWGMQSAEADTCALYVLNQAGTALKLIGVRGVAPEIVEKIRVLTKDTANPLTLESVHSGRTLWAESHEDYVALFPVLAAEKASGRRVHAFWSVPLIVEGRPSASSRWAFMMPAPSRPKSARSSIRSPSSAARRSFARYGSPARTKRSAR